VWTREDKNHFLDSILRGYPFPEIYLADGDVDLDSGAGAQLLVDGLQRVNTMIQYFDGDPDLVLTTVPSYRDLSKDDKTSYLQYEVAVRDLGVVTKSELIEVFKRINATKYALIEMEINNAVYHGALKQFAKRISEDAFFERHRVFNSTDYRRMGDLRYALQLIITMISGYFNRDDAFQSYLERFNDEFPAEDEVSDRIGRTFDFIEECNFSRKSRVWRKADLLTLIVELDRLMMEGVNLQPSEVLQNIDSFFDAVEAADVSSERVASIYYKAALQASNDRANRLRRGVIIGGVIRGMSEDDILGALRDAGVLETKSQVLPLENELPGT